MKIQELKQIVKDLGIGALLAAGITVALPNIVHAQTSAFSASTPNSSQPNQVRLNQAQTNSTFKSNTFDKLLSIKIGSETFSFTADQIAKENTTLVQAKRFDLNKFDDFNNWTLNDALAHLKYISNLEADSLSDNPTDPLHLIAQAMANAKVQLAQEIVTKHEYSALLADLTIAFVNGKADNLSTYNRCEKALSAYTILQLSTNEELDKNTEYNNDAKNLYKYFKNRSIPASQIKSKEVAAISASVKIDVPKPQEEITEENNANPTPANNAEIAHVDNTAIQDLIKEAISETTSEATNKFNFKIEENQNSFKIYITKNSNLNTEIVERRNEIDYVSSTQEYVLGYFNSKQTVFNTKQQAQDRIDLIQSWLEKAEEQINLVQNNTLQGVVQANYLSTLYRQTTNANFAQEKKFILELNKLIASQNIKIANSTHFTTKLRKWRSFNNVNRDNAATFINLYNQSTRTAPTRYNTTQARLMRFENEKSVLA